ncbi:MAG: flavin reductase family protein [Actinobacteria bacterium]|nr:flavin reductase family protein [Actinomycetota bacterium]
MAKKLKDPTTALFPCPVVLVTSVDANLKPNIITLAWVGTICSEPPMIGISIRPSRYSHKLISESKEFVVNIPSEDLVFAVDYCGVVSGKDIDKFKQAKLTSVSALQVKPPLIEECPVNIECKVKNIISLGTHDLFIGEVVKVHIDEDVLDEKGKVDIAKAKPFAYTVHEYWSLKEKIGFYGYSKKGS